MVNSGLTPEEIEKQAESTAIHWGKVMIPLQQDRESKQALVSFKAGMEAQRAKLRADDKELAEMVAEFDWESWRDKEHSCEWKLLTKYEKEPHLRDAKQLLSQIVPVIEARKQEEKK